ncbi:MAG: Ig-like domain-containing protein [Patescibacteria group bacterium]
MARSRLSKKQQKKIVRQTFLIATVAISLLASFIFFIMPQFIRLADSFLNGSSVLEDQDQVPPQAPILAAPVSATNSASLPISGVGEAGSQAVLMLNGEKLKEIEIDDQGEFKFRVPLTEGENALAVYSIDKAGNESVQTREYNVSLDTEAPVIEIESPEDGGTIELRKNQIVTIKGTTEPQSKVFINDRLVYAKSDGSFSMNYELEDGENKLKFRAVDKGGNESEKEIIVKFRF